MLGRKARKVKRLTSKGSWFKKKVSGTEMHKVRLSSRPKPKKKTQQSTDCSTSQPETVLFIPNTPDSQLKKILQAAEAILNKFSFGRVKVVETLGPKLNQQLSNTSPWKKDPCGRDNCAPCRTKPGQCLSRNVTYHIECQV